MKEVEISRFFSEKDIEEIARKTSFVRRKSPITGFKFLLTFTTGLLNTPDGTIAQLAGFLSGSCETRVSAQAVDERLKDKAQKFMEAILEKVLALCGRTLKIETELLANFDHVYVIDSTNFDLHPSLADKFKGSGGDASKASMRIQLVFDYITGKIHVEIGDTTLSDAKTLHEIIKEKKLDSYGKAFFLQDLGYFKTETFKMMSDLPDCFFISKMKFNTKICDELGEKVNLGQIIKKRPAEFDMRINIGQLKCRIVGKRLPESVVNQKIRKANEDTRRRGGSQITEEYRLFLEYAIFITNLPEEYDEEKLFLLYRIRWRVELIFKTWKSILKIHKIRSARAERVMCEVCGKLILAALSSMICGVAEENIAQNAVVSLHRAMRQMKVLAFAWTAAIIRGCRKHIEFIMRLSEQIRRLCIKREQKEKPTLEQRIKKIKMKNEANKQTRTPLGEGSLLSSQNPLA